MGMQGDMDPQCLYTVFFLMGVWCDLHRFGLCIPQACTEDDVLSLVPNVPSVSCGIDNSYSTGTYVMISLTIFLLLLVAAGTTIELVSCH